MQNIMTPWSALFHTGLFAVAMVALTVLGATKFGLKSVEGFLVVDRRVRWWLGGPAITASWTWAVALMISVQMAYEQGLAGIFWFTVPNVFAVLIYIWLAPAIRARLQGGYSLPEWMHVRFRDEKVTKLYLFVFVYYQVMAAVVQIYAGAHIIAAATGIDAFWLMPTVLVITLAYALISGMEASIITDFVQTALLLVPGWVLVVMVGSAAHWQMNVYGIGPGGGLNPFDPSIALTAGVISSIALISNAICDQQFWQRCFTIAEGDLRRSFWFGALLFATIPISLSLLGFVAAAPSVGLVLPEKFDNSLVGFAIVGHLLPKWAAILYLYMILAGLCSTLDSALSAVSALRTITRKEWRDVLLRSEGVARMNLNKARGAMVALGVTGLIIAYGVELIPGFGLKYLWWVFGAMSASIAIPTVASLFWDRLTARGVLSSAIVGACAGFPLIVYASIAKMDWLLAATYAGVLCASGACCLMFRSDRRQELPGSRAH